MWIKITDKEQLRALQPGNNLIKYPISGTPLEDFSDAHPDNISLRVVTTNDGGPEEIRMAIPLNVTNFDPIMGMTARIVAPVAKHYDEIIRESVWWIPQ